MRSGSKPTGVNPWLGISGRHPKISKLDIVVNIYCGRANGASAVKRGETGGLAKPDSWNWFRAGVLLT